MNIVEMIPYGKDNVVYIPNKETALRDLIAEANQNGDCIINIRGGYFRPIPGNEEDEAALEHYLARELSRARSILYKRQKMKESFKRLKYEALK